MYCINCGVELAAGERRCPLCGVHVPLPEPEPGAVRRPYPAVDKPVETVSRAGQMFVLTILFALPFVITLAVDLRTHGTVTWSGYPAGAVLMIYVIAMLPIWFTAPNPVIFVPADFAAAALYLAYINYATGGDWFTPFALPVTLASAALVTALVALLRYVRRGQLYIIGGGVIALGGLAVLIEYLLYATFGISGLFRWSLYPLAACTLIGLALIVIAAVRPWREALHRKFFI